MHRSPPVHKMASTMGGMRRLLKRPPRAERYLRQAVETGVYRSPDAILTEEQPRYRQRQGGGAKILDYPMEYRILKLNPPIPSPPRVPRQLREERKKSELPTERLVRNYLKRHQHDNDSSSSGGPKSVEQYYERLLGIPPPSNTSALGQKSSLLNRAYAFAVKQHEIMRQQDMAEEESLAIVEELLQQQDVQERRTSRSQATSAAQWRKNTEQATEEGPAASTTSSSSENDEKEPPSLSSSSSFDNATADDTSSIPSILHGHPRAVRGMTLWSKRLEAVPYKEWTIGATVALDHWIARSVLQLEEETWEELLEGGNPSLTSRGRDIVMVRQSLFPETVTVSEEDQLAALEEAAETQEDSPTLSSVDKTVDELLASLKGFDETEAASFWKDDKKDAKVSVEDDEVAALIDELQRWRAQNAKSPYEKWTREEQADLKEWIKKYVTTLATDADEEVDLEATRKALLASPPLDRGESDDLWEQLRDEAEAEVYLQSMLEAGPPAASDTASEAERKARQVYNVFCHLPYNVQLRKLVDFGTLRPLFDEYTSEKDRVKFLARHGDKLLDGLDLEHLVPDPEGPITGEDLGQWGEEYGINKEDRFRLELMRYGTDEFGSSHSERARELYRAWNAHKANRARYEELMFKRKKLGLRYSKAGKSK